VRQGEYKLANGCLVPFGLIFGGAGIFVAFAMISGYANGRPMKIYVNDKLVENPSIWLQVGTGFMPILFILIGTLCVIYWLRAKVEFKGDGIVAYGITGKPTFDARWKDITFYQVEKDDEGQRIVLESHSEILRIDSSTPKWDEIKAELDQMLKAKVA